MKNILLMAALALFYQPALISADDLSRAADGLVSAASAKQLTKFAIEPFEAEDAAGADAAVEARAAFSQVMYGLYGIGVADSEVLDTLKERGRFWAQVRVRGKLFKSASGRTLVLIASEADSESRLTIVQLELDKNGRRPQGDFRDAPAGDWCALEASALKAENRRLVDAKARYWALQVRMPGFSPKDLGTPASRGVVDYATMQKFYLESNRYYEQLAPVGISTAEREEIKLLMDKEKEFQKRCPGHR